MSRAHGVDLSHWDVAFDPAKATGQIDFAIMKASEGKFRDRQIRGDLGRSPKGAHPRRISLPAFRNGLASAS